MSTDNERLARIETNLKWLVDEWKTAKDGGFPRCATHAQQITNLEKSATLIRRLLFSACALPFVGGAIAKYVGFL